MDGSLSVNACGVGENGRVFFHCLEFLGIIDILDEVTGVIGTLLGVFWCDFVFVWRDHRNIGLDLGYRLQFKLKTCRRSERRQVNKKRRMMFFELPAAA